MRQLELRRDYQPTHTSGILRFMDTGVCFFTLELPWLENARNISCIPEGVYQARPWLSRRHGRCVRLIEVPNRTNILIHSGNRVYETQGCILVGTNKSDSGDFVGHSRLAVDNLLTHLNGENAQITISSALPGT